MVYELIVFGKRFPRGCAGRIVNSRAQFRLVSDRRHLAVSLGDRGLLYPTLSTAVEIQSVELDRNTKSYCSKCKNTFDRQVGLGKDELKLPAPPRSD